MKGFYDKQVQFRGLDTNRLEMFEVSDVPTVSRNQCLRR